MSFDSFTIPDGSDYDETASEYNAEPERITVTVADRYAPSLDPFDLGVNSNTSSIEEWTDDQTVKPSDETEYRIWKMVVHTGDPDLTGDSDSDGNYDEGVREIFVEISGGRQATSTNEGIFNPNNGIDRLGSNDKAEVQLDDLKATSNQPLTVEVGAVTFSTSTTGASAGGETLTDGENPIDVQLFDDSGAGTSLIDVLA